VIGLGAVFITKSEPAASSADDPGVVGIGDPAVAATAPTPTPVLLPGGVLPHAPHGTPVEYTVCTTNGSWTRPSRELEAAHLATGLRGYRHAHRERPHLCVHHAANRLPGGPTALHRLGEPQDHAPRLHESGWLPHRIHPRQLNLVRRTLGTRVRRVSCRR